MNYALQSKDRGWLNGFRKQEQIHMLPTRDSLHAERHPQTK